ncbi:unnamed protein product [Prorocentrum cordatum]|uniref:Uncharacterized protein n=1 Tax=Prorocentrum cordatum TaxID=2364126 RepID=A0ABN9Q9R7_9DINO|nr:unnamed protein product [Polarella glacialis]
MKSLCYFFHHGLRPPSTAGTLQAKRDLTRKEMDQGGGGPGRGRRRGSRNSGVPCVGRLGPRHRRVAAGGAKL